MRKITVVIDVSCRAGQIPLIWGAAEGDGRSATEAALADAREWSDIQWTASDCAVINWDRRCLPSGQDKAAIELAINSLVRTGDSDGRE